MNKTMKALVLHSRTKVSLENVPVPEPQKNEVLVKIKSCAICGSDPKLMFDPNGIGPDIHPYPFIPGHEASGEVVALGEGVTKFKVGDRVAIEAHCGCGYCENCLKGNYTICLNFAKPETGHRQYGFHWNGAYAEYAAYNIKALTPIPEGVSYDEAAMCDTAGTPMNGINIIGITPGGYCAIVGPGPIGLCAMMIAKAKGANTIVIGRGARLERAAEIGADYIVDMEKENVRSRILEITNGLGADESIECAGNENSINEAISVVRRGGKVALLGWPSKSHMNIYISPLLFDQITVAGVRANPNCSRTVMSLMKKGSLHVKDIITHRFALEDYMKAFETFTKRIDGALKVIINP
jgi:L-iditol 2-dehydrogenase